MQRRCLLKQKAVGTKHLPSSSNCCQLWKRGVDTLSKPEVQQVCHFGLSFHFCSPQKPFRLRSRVTLATSPRLIVSRYPNRLSSLHYPAYLSSRTLSVSLLQLHHTVVQPGLLCHFPTHPDALKLLSKETIFCLRIWNKVGEYKKHPKAPKPEY